MVDLLTRAVDLLVFFARVNLCSLCLLIFIVILVFFRCFLPPFLLKQLWAFFSLGSCGPLSFVAFQNFPWIWGFYFLHVGISFLYALRSPVLVFINEVFFLFKLLGRLLRPIAPSIIMSSFGLRCLWWLLSVSFMEAKTVFCSSLVNSSRFSLMRWVDVFACV